MTHNNVYFKITYFAARGMLAGFLLLFFACTKAEFQVNIKETGCYNIIAGDDLISGSGNLVEVIIPVELKNLRKGIVSLTVETKNLWDEPVSDYNIDLQIDIPANSDLFETPVVLYLPNGFFRIGITATHGRSSVNAYTEIGIVPPTAEGLRPNSFFASNTSDIKLGKDLALLDLMGIKVQRTHFYPDLVEIPAVPSALPLPFDYSRLQDELNETVEKGIWVLPIAGYAFPGTKSELAEKMNNHGPPRHFEEFTRSWVEIIKKYSEIRVYELWNEPWIYEWTWAANAEEYRELQDMWCRMVLDADPDLRLIAGNSCMFVEDNIEPFPEIWEGLIHATSHHPYANAEARSLRHNAQIRSIDYGYLVNRRMGLPYYYLTEGGTLYSTRPEDTIGVGHNNNVNASKAVQYSVISALHGAYQTNIQWNLGFGPAWTRSNTTLAVCSHFLEDKPIVADIWPGNSLIYGAIFAHPAYITGDVKKLSRAGELNARWTEDVPENALNKDLKVAVVFNLTGLTADSFDMGGSLILDDHLKIRAFDCVGREILPEGDRLLIPFNEYPVYLTSSEMSVMELHQAIAGAKMENLTGLNFYASSLVRAADQDQALTVRFDNHLNRSVKGYLRIEIDENTIGNTSFELMSGELKEIHIPLQGKIRSADNMYPMVLFVESDAGNFQKQQIVQRALFTRGTKVIDGKLEDWINETPVILDSDMLKKGIELTQFLFNPSLERPKSETTAKRVAARIFTAFDEDYVYIAAEVLEDTLLNRAGQPAAVHGIETGYLLGMPAGLTHPRYTGDLFMFGFGFRDRVPGFGRQMNDPLAWKGQFYDTDYLYLAYNSALGSQLIRQWGAGTSRQNGFQTDPVTHINTIPDAEIEITRDETTKTTVYEIAIPRKEIALFSESDKILRFGFVLINNEGAGKSGKLEWAEAAGVFDYWLNSGSYAPTWDQYLPCQTFFGIGR